MSYRMLASVGALALVASGVVLAMPEPTTETTPVTRCMASAEFTEQSVILVLDRTTKQSAGDNFGWKQAVHAIFENPSIGGRVRLMEIRDTDVTFTLSAPLCVRTLPDRGGVRPPVEAGGAKALVRKVSAWLGVDDPPPNPNLVEDDAADRAASLRLAQRAAVQKQVEELVDSDRPTYPSALVVPLFKVLQTECAGRKTCRVYMFSDLIDSKVRRRLKAGTESATVLAQRTYQQNLQIYHPHLHSTQLHVVSWGIGRDDADAQKALTPGELLSLTSFWSTLFEQLCDQAGRGSRITVTALFPSNENAGCNNSIDPGSGSRPR